MNDSSVTLYDIFDLSDEDTNNQTVNRWDKLASKIRDEIKDVKWTASIPELSQKIGDLLNIKVPDIFIASWKKEQELQKVINESESAPDEVFYVELAEHTIKSEHHPYIEIIVEEVQVKKIEFLLSILFKTKGFILKICNGLIEEIQTGNCEVEGTFGYKDLILAKKKLSPIKMPGKISL